MQRYSINNESDILKEEKELDFSVRFFINNLEKYINQTLTGYINIKLECAIDLITENEIYLTLNDKVIYNPICQLLNVKFESMERDKQLDYYLITLKNKLSELNKITSEEELSIKFPYLYSIYTKRKERIKYALDIYGKTYRVIPAEEANYIKIKNLIKYDMKEETYQQLLIESTYFNIINFIRYVSYDIASLINNLPMFLNSLSSFIININALRNIDKNKVSLILK